jgi:LuxR family maltose regulon positive regulatory protein
MAVPVLTTKLNIPPVRNDWVPRQRLLDKLNAGLHSKLTLVSASAGFGKTTLLSEWSGRSQYPVAWLSLDEGENDPVRFMHYLLAALQKVDEDIGRGLSSILGTPRLPPPESLITTLINELPAAVGPVFLVLDDYHAIRAEWIHEAVEFLIERMPAQMHLVLATRHDPPLSLPRLRVRNQLLELREDDLRFTADEAAVFLSQALDLRCDANIISALEARTEGWIAGLQLAALSMKGRSQESLGDFVAAFSGSHRHVIDYLADEVLAQQPEEIRAFLQQTSILDRLTAPLCDALTGRDDSATILRQLEHSNLFLIPLDDQRTWYRYHRLFADFLRTDLEERDRTMLHVKAARWFEAQELWPESVKHALASGEVWEAARTIGLAADSALQIAALTTLDDWLDALPDQVVRDSVELATYKGFASFYRGLPGQAASYAQAAGRKLNADAPPASVGRLLALQAHLSLSGGSYAEAIELGRESLACLDKDDHLFRGLTLNLLGQSLEWQGDVAAAADAYREGASTGRKAADHVGALAAQTNLAFALNELGRLQEAIALCQDFEDEVRRTNRPSLPARASNLAWSWLSYEANELDCAGEQARQALNLSQGAGFADAILRVQYTLARVHLAQGEMAAARQVVQDAHHLMARLNLELPQAGWFAALEAEINLRAGDIAAAMHWAETSGLGVDDSPGRYEGDIYLTFARLLMAQSRYGEADRILSTMERSAVSGGRLRTLITIYLLQARILSAQGRKVAARDRVESALDLAAPQGYLRALLDEGQQVATMLPEVRHVAPQFVDSLLEAFSGKAALAEGTADSPVEPLTERELEILRLIAAGRSNPEIAESLYLSLNTVKWHAKNLYGKLGVSNRVEAAARAQELGVL